MTITLEVTEEAKESLAAQAEAKGLPMEAFLRAIITTQAAMGPVSELHALAEREDADRTIDEMFDLVPLAPEVGEGAASRREWYR